MRRRMKTRISRRKAHLKRKNKRNKVAKKKLKLKGMKKKRPWRHQIHKEYFDNTLKGLLTKQIRISLAILA